MSGTRYPVTLTHLPMAALFEARGGEAGLAQGLANAGFAMPASRNRIEQDVSGVELIRLGPERVLLLADMAQENALAARLQAEFIPVADADVAMVSDMFAGFALEGPGAEDVLRQGAPLDLSPSRFPVGMATGTELWSTSILLIRRADAVPLFHIFVERSYAGYLADWLAVAMGGTTVEQPGVMRSPPASLRPS